MSKKGQAGGIDWGGRVGHPEDCPEGQAIMSLQDGHGARWR
jgi:hypothetical protein